MRRNRNYLFEDFDSSPNTARYLVFKAATFKPRNSSIARTTAGSMDTVLSLAVNHSSMDALLSREPRHELSAKDLAQHFHRQEEVMRQADPASMIRRQSAAGHHAVNVRMRLQGLTPGMENAQEADLSPEVLGIGSDFQQCLGAGLEQELEQDPLVLPHQRNQRVRHAED